jgi:hypothetical protein
VIRRLYGSPLAARADAFGASAIDHAQPAAHAHRDTAARPAPSASERHGRARDDARVHGRRRAPAPSSSYEAATTTGATGASTWRRA